MIQCPSCSAMNAEESMFCESCGLVLKEKQMCKSCGAPCGAMAKFCQNCGKPLARVGQAPGPTARMCSSSMWPLLVGMVASAVAMAGVFLPFIHTSASVSQSYLRLAPVAGLAVIGLALVSGVGLLIGFHLEAALFALVGLALTGYRLFKATSVLLKARTGADIEGTAAGISGISPGGIIIVISLIALFAASCWASRARKVNRRKTMHWTPK